MNPLEPQPSSALAPRIGVGVVGTGIMGRRMLAALLPHPQFQVTTLWDPDSAALQAALAATPGARAASGLQALVDDPAVQLVYVASPPGHHLAAALACAQAGRACLCEKPLAHDVAEGETLCQAVAAAGTPFAVNFPFARSAAALGLADLLQRGALGTVRQARVSARFAQWPRPWQAGASSWLAAPAQGGFTREVLSHFVFLALRLFGPATVAHVQRQQQPGQAETALQATLQHSSGVLLQIDAAVAGSVADQNRFELTGSAGSAALTDWARLEHNGTEVLPRSDGTARTLDAVARQLQGQADHGLATADEALAVVRIIEALLAAPARA